MGFGNERLPAGDSICAGLGTGAGNCGRGEETRDDERGRKQHAAKRRLGSKGFALISCSTTMLLGVHMGGKHGTGRSIVRVPWETK